MKINYLIYKNITEDYTIEKVDFRRRLTLLVGASGVGKTQILNALRQICQFAGNRKMTRKNAFEAELGFATKDNKEYIWKIKTSLQDKRLEADVEGIGIRVLEESLSYTNGNLIFFKNEEGVTISGYEQVPMSKENESLISQYQNMANVNEVYWELRMMESSNLEEDMSDFTPSDFFLDDVSKNKKIGIELAERFASSAMVSPFVRFGTMKLIELPEYASIHDSALEQFQDIFPTIQDIDYVENEMNQYGIAIKTNDHWVMQKNISSGMLKSSWHIINILTVEKDAVIMMDEFENGLRIKCIDVVSNMILEERPDIQIIMTSHHPYIINCIPMENWLITRRVGKKVQTISAQDYHLGQSKHEAYIELMNRLKQEELQGID